MKKVFAIIKKNIVACVCLLLAVAVILTGTISYSKYISTDTVNKMSVAGSFYCSGTVDSVSSLSFANTEFWSVSGDEKIALNTVHTINFAVNNYQETTGEDGITVTKTVSAVKMRYTLVFTMPVVFAEKIAFQLFENYSTALLPQIVIEDLMKADSLYDTASSEDYQEEPSEQLEFTVDKSSESLSFGGESFYSYSATAPLSDDSGDAVIKFEPVLSELNQVLKFRLWDLSKSEVEYNKEYPATVESGELISPVFADISGEVPCYRISISMPQFIFGAGAEEQSKYSIRFAPTSMLDDYQLCGELCEQNGNVLESLYAGKSVTVNTLEETVTDTDKDSGNVISQNSYYVFGNPRTYTADESEPLSESTYTDTTTSGPVVTTYGANTNDNGYLYFDEHWTIVDKSSDAALYAISFTSVSASQEVSSSTTATTTVSETATTNSVSASGNKETITLTISKTSQISEVTQTTTKTLIDSYTIATYSTNYLTYKKSGGTWQTDSSVYNEFISLSWPIVYNTSTPTNNTVTETYTRTIERVKALSSAITFDKVYRANEDESGNAILDENGEATYIYFDSAENALELFAADENDEKQLYYLSQCYSKSYPVSVNVIFEQIQS